MRRTFHTLTGVVSVLALAVTALPAFAQKSGGILKSTHRDNPPSASPHEEATSGTQTPFMAVFNNLVMFKQDERINSMENIVPDLAKSWAWNADKTALTFVLNEGVKWHDGKPFTSADVKCTWDLLTEKRPEKLRKNPRQAWYSNLDNVTTNGDYEVTFNLKRTQPAFIALLAAGYSPVYSCHVPPAKMRTHPIGTGPFKFVAMKMNESIKLTKNKEYFKPGLPYLDGIEYTIIKSPATRNLAFVAGNFDMTYGYDLTPQLMEDVKSQDPNAVCELVTAAGAGNLIVNRDSPPFDNAEIRRAMALTIDRASFNTIIGRGTNRDGGAMLPPPEGVWGLPPEMLKTLPGYDPDVAKNRAEARKIMEAQGYGPEKRLPIRVATRNVGVYKDPGVLLIDQLREIYMDATLETIETANWFGMVARKDYQVGMNLTASGVDDPDAMFFENYACGSERNYTGYCNPELEKLFVQQSMMSDQEARKKLVWEIDMKLQLDGARPIIYHFQWATCWHPYVHGLKMMTNSMYNGWRLEEVWMDK